MTKWPEIRDSKKYKNWYETNKECESQRLIFEKTYQGLIDTWDYQWHFACKLNGRFSIVSNNNLISNIGFGLDATHTVEKNHLSEMPVKGIKFPLKHPKEVKINYEKDKRNKIIWNNESLKNKIINKIIKIIKIIKYKK
jgi:uncharacterized protein YueI